MGGVDGLDGDLPILARFLRESIVVLGDRRKAVSLGAPIILITICCEKI